MSQIPKPTPDDLSRDLAADYALATVPGACPIWSGHLSGAVTAQLAYAEQALAGWPAALRRLAAAEARAARYWRALDELAELNHPDAERIARAALDGKETPHP